MTRYYGDEVGNSLPSDLEKTDVASAASAGSTSKDSYTKKITLALVKNKKYIFWFTYKHQDPDTKEIKESDRSPIWTEYFAIPNLTKAVQNLTLTAGVQSYGVKFTLDPLSVQQDVAIFESFTSNFASQSLVYEGTSTNVSILTTGATAFTPRWVKVRSRDRWDDLTNISEVTAGPVTPVDPIAAAIDVTPPASASSISAAWSGNNLSITATVDASAKKFIIKLTNGNTEGFFTKFPSAAGTSQTILITEQELYETLGSYFTSFTGLFISADALDNRDIGTAFSVAQKTNPLLGVIPTFDLTAITNGYTATWVLPAGAAYAKVYERATSWGGSSPTVGELVFSGQSPAIVKKTVYTTRYVKIQYLSTDGFTSSFSAEQSVTPIDAIAADVNAPNAPATISATAGTDSTGTVGFNGFVNISWSAVSDATLRGYRIRFRPYKASAPFENYSHVDSPGTGTSYRLGSLALGTVYEIGIASYDEFNNTSSVYTALSPNITVSGSPFIGTNVSTTGYFEAGVSGTDTGTFKFGYGVDTGKRGLVLNASNYWYIDSAQSALFKIGGSANNFVSWNGTKLSIDGDLGVAGGTNIGGNISMGTSGASIFQGTLTSGNLSSDGFLLNSGGLVIKKGAVQLRLDTSDGGIYAERGSIAGWTIDSSKIERLTSSKYSGISSSGSYSFYAGAATSGNSTGDTGASFWVKPDGTAKASGITITGGSLDVGADWPTGGFHVNSSGVLQAKGATIAGALTIEGGSTFAGNIEVTSGGTIFMGSSNANTNRVVLTTAGIAGYAAAAPIFSLNTSGTGIIGGWAFDSTSLSSSGMTLDSSNQTIVFKQGYKIDQDSFSIPAISTSTQSGSSQTENDTPDSVYGSSSSTSTSVLSSTLSIKPSAGVTAGGVLYLSQTPIAATLSAGSSYISTTSSGIVLNSTTTGAYVFKNLSGRAHNNYYGNESAAMLMIKTDGTVSVGRTIFKSGTSETSINGGSHSSVGLIGDIILSTAD